MCSASQIGHAKYHVITLPWSPAGDDFKVKDQTGAVRFTVKGKVMTMRDKMVICNEAGEKVAMLQRKLLSLKSTFQVRCSHVGPKSSRP